MVSSFVDFVLGAGLQLVLLLLGLLPSVDVSSLPIAPPQAVRDALGALNCFIPIGDLITIITVWIGLILAVNVVVLVSGIVTKFGR